MTGSLEQQILAGIAVCPDYLLADPPDDELLDEEFVCGDREASDDLSPDDPLWEAFYAAPFELPTDPQREHWLQELSLT